MVISPCSASRTFIAGGTFVHTLWFDVLLSLTLLLIEGAIVRLVMPLTLQERVVPRRVVVEREALVGICGRGACRGPRELVFDVFIVGFWTQ